MNTSYDISTTSPSTNTNRCKKKLNLEKNEIHVWITKPQSLTNEALLYSNTELTDLLTKYRALLTDEESKKQQRYKFEKDRHDALITRAFIRDLLSYYAEIKPQDWRFEKGQKDKPEIVNPPIPLRFNISHTKGLIICAVTLNEDIGCDVENISRKNDVLAIADRYFSVEETNTLFSLPVEQQRSRFFDYWTLKESYIKAWGLGLAIPLADFTFTLGNQAPKKNTAFTIKSDISLSFAEHREDNADKWRSWLLYPNQLSEEETQHRVAFSIRSQKNNQ
jgi:4'-phosphopantetheinyl transferase